MNTMRENLQPMTLDQLTPPYVSLVVPVYNVEDYLRRCLDSLVYQTLQEIEIILVNDCSPDNSQTIIDEYVARYPGKVRCICHEENQGQAIARKTGFEAARAPYILFPDSDDFLDGTTCEQALKLALEGGYDLVGLNATHWDEQGKRYGYRSRPESYDNDTVVRTGIASFCQYLFQADFLRGKDIFIPVLFEDACVLPWIFMQAERIGWLESGVQYFYTRREGSTMTGAITERWIQGCLGADTFAWDRVVPGYESALADRIADRMYGTAQKFPGIYVQTVQHIQKLFPLLEPWVTDALDPEHLAFLRDVTWLPAEPAIPCLLYCNGFGGAQPDMAQRMADLSSDEWQCIELNETNCDLSSAPEAIRTAHREGRMEDVAVYFAMERIVRDGGMYAAHYTHPLSSIAALRFDQAFFPAGSDNSVALHFFGGAAGNRLMQQALRTCAGASMADRITDRLFTEYNVHLRGREEQGLYGVHILAAERCILPEPNSYCFINAANPDEDYISMPMDACQRALQAKQNAIDGALNQRIRALQAVHTLKENRDAIKEERNALKSERNALKKERNALKSERNDLKQEVKKLKKERESLKSQRDAQAALAKRYDSLLKFSLVGWAYKLCKRIKK